ncbi:MAG: hypothetical protein A3I73_00135 [Omnitrophica bacterium RIFCSPLOWO2_02_FULL_45_16]|nr:MAG: hypothetical protein A3I73_00135 [Omnitrophica bacterium RIFCSPLOWO2_02_FULL_45_16]
MRKIKVNIIVLNYNGRQLLEKYIPSILAAAKRSRHYCTVSVVDNKSTDDSVDFLGKTYKDVIIYEAKENRVLCSLNGYLNMIDDEVVILLNNDIEADQYFVDPLIEPFANKDLLFVAPKELDSKGKYHGNLNRLSFKFGLISTTPEEKGRDVRQYNSSIGGGAFDRKKLIYLGCFDDLYLPGIFEDLDVCYRGWKHGWEGIYEPASFYYHEGGTSFKAKYGNRGKAILAHRNTFLFFWKNVTSPRMFFIHIVFIPVLLIGNLLKGRWLFIEGFFQALGMLKTAMRKRAVVKNQFSITDEEVLRRPRMPYQIITDPPQTSI